MASDNRVILVVGGDGCTRGILEQTRPDTTRLDGTRRDTTGQDQTRHDFISHLKIDMSDWTGSSRQRNANRDDCLYPHAKPTPKPVEYVVASGTSCLMKRAGDKQWKQFRTTKELVFDSTYGETDKSCVFFRVGFLLCVSREQLSTREAASNGDA